MVVIFKAVIVDDEPIIVQGLQKAVDWEKYNCVVVGSGHDAKSGAERIREFKPDILFTDIKMPDDDGLTMLAGLKSEFPNMQVTVLTGHREFEYAARAIRLGAARFLLKPSKMAEIEEALDAMTKRLDEIRRLYPEPMEEAEEVEETDDDAEEAENGRQPERGEANRFIVNAALKYITAHCREKLTLLDVADEIYVSQWHLSKLLNKYLKKNFYDLVNESRIEQAKELMRDPRLRLGEISDIVGFADISHFSRTFKKVENVSPKEYRNTMMEL